MSKFRVLMLIGTAFVLFFVSLGGCQHVPKAFKGTSPQYIGLGEFENPSQGLNFTVYRKESPNPNVPVIKHAYSIDRGIYGTILKIYIEAEDPNGEMAKIATTVDQVGYGHYPTDFIILKPEYRKSFKGYIEWNTFSTHIFRMGEFVRQYVTVAVMDKTGNSSNEFVFPFTFDTGVEPAPNPPAPFDQGSLPKLGNIFIDLFDPFQMGAGSQNDRN
jgi:hypothetical protein